MSQYVLKIELLSDTTFGRGDGVAGLIDQEVEHDPLGFPYLRGRTLKGLLREECDNLIAVLPPSSNSRWQLLAQTLFGRPGSGLDTIAALHIGDACLPDDLRRAVALQIESPNSELTPVDVLSSLTTVRKQTAIDSVNGTAADRSLRASRVVLRSNTFTAALHLTADEAIQPDLSALLAAGILALRRIGSGRNRGRGHVRCSLWQNPQDDITHQQFKHFQQKTQSEVRS